MGSCSGGKSTMAHFLGTEFGIPYYALDDLFIDYVGITNDLVPMYPLEKRKRAIQKVLAKDSWIIEGIYILDEIFAQADVIILVKHNIFRVLLWQWKRLLSDSFEWQRFGIWHNLILSQIIWNQFFSRKDYYHRVGIDYPTMKMFKKICDKYKDKVLYWKGNEYKRVLNEEKLLKYSA